jgi:hypothetical protein
MLTGRIERNQVFDATDLRSIIPRFRGENLERNVDLVYLRQNAAATGVALSADEIAELSALFDPARVPGARYPDTERGH